MGFSRALGAGSWVALLAMVAAGCSSDTRPGQFDSGRGNNVDAVACTPGDTSRFVPTPAGNPPRAARPGACSGADVGAFIDCLYGLPADGELRTCVNARPAACASCLLSAPTEAALGPFVTAQPAPEINQAGCVALVNQGACTGYDAINLLLCINTACDWQTGGPCEGVSDAEFTACTDAASGRGGACATYATRGASRCLANSLTFNCFLQASDGDDYTRMLTFVTNTFCGPSAAAGDAGSATPDAGALGDGGTSADAARD